MARLVQNNQEARYTAVEAATHDRHPERSKYRFSERDVTYPIHHREEEGEGDGSPNDEPDRNGLSHTRRRGSFALVDLCLAGGCVTHTVDTRQIRWPLSTSSEGG